MSLIVWWLLEIALTLFIAVIIAIWSLRYSNKNDLTKDLHGRIWWWMLERLWLLCSLWTMGWTIWRL